MTVLNDEILRFIAGFIAEHEYSPSIREIGQAVGLSSTAMVKERIDKLSVQGKLTYTPHIARSLRVVA